MEHDCLMLNNKGTIITRVEEPTWTEWKREKSKRLTKHGGCIVADNVLSFERNSSSFQTQPHTRLTTYFDGSFVSDCPYTTRVCFDEGEQLLDEEGSEIKSMCHKIEKEALLYHEQLLLLKLLNSALWCNLFNFRSSSQTYNSAKINNKSADIDRDWETLT